MNSWAASFKLQRLETGLARGALGRTEQDQVRHRQFVESTSRATDNPAAVYQQDIGSLPPVLQLLDRRVSAWYGGIVIAGGNAFDLVAR